MFAARCRILRSPGRGFESLLVAAAALLLLLFFAGPQLAAAAIYDPDSYASLGSLNPTGNVTVNTSGSSPSMTGGAGFTGVVSGGAAVFAFADVEVSSGVSITVSGNRPLVILSQGSMEFDGTIDVSANGTSGGPGASQGGNGATSWGLGDGIGAGNGDNTVSGAGHGGTGGMGEGGSPAGGIVYGDLSLSLVGGSGGGMSAYFLNGYGGGGGGVVELGARGTLDFGGTILADGNEGFVDGYGGGGGSGGGIVLHSTHGDVNMSGTLNARGGKGGDALSNGYYGGGGGGGGRVFLQGVSVNTTGGTINVSGGAGGNHGQLFPGTGNPGNNGVSNQTIVTPPNNPPTIDSFSISLNENATYTFDRAADFEDPSKGNFDDPNNGQLEEMRVATLPNNGVLEFQGNEITPGQLPFDIDRDEIDQLVYVPDAYYNGPDAFEYNASDGIDFALGNETVDIDVLPYNNAPVFDNSGNPWLNNAFTGVISPRGTSVTTLLSRGAGSDPISDPDVLDPRGIALIGTDETHGTWEYTLDDGDTWSPVGSVSESNALLLDDSNEVQLRYFAASFAGTINPAIEFRAWDQYEGANGDYYDIPATGGTGGMNAFSTASETAFIEVQEPPEIMIERDATPISDGGTDSLANVVAPLARQSLVYTVRNDGAGTLTLTGTPRVEIPTASNAIAHLIVVPDETLAPGEETTFTLHVTPLALGAFSAEVMVESDDPATPAYGFTLEGTAGTVANITLAHDGTDLAPGSRLALGGLTTQGPRTLVFTVRNDGAAELNDLNAVILATTNAAAVIDQNVGETTLGPGEDTSFVLSLRPMSTGSMMLELGVTSDDPAQPSYTVYLTGTGTNSLAPTLTIERLPGVALPKPSAQDELGMLEQDESTAVRWTLRNTGFSDLELPAVDVDNESNVAVVVAGSPTVVLSAGESTELLLVLEPGAGPFNFTITVESTDFTHPVQEVHVSGEGTNVLEPSLAVYAAGDFEPVEHGATVTLPAFLEEMMQSTYPFVLVNRGTAPLTIQIPVQLAALINCTADIWEQPGTGGASVVELNPQEYAVLRTTMQPHDVSQGASFELHISSNDAQHPTYIITAEAYPEGFEFSPLSTSRGCATLPHKSNALQTLLILCVLITLALLRQRRPTPIGAAGKF